jgi:hypothetical protein
MASGWNTGIKPGTGYLRNIASDTRKSDNPKKKEICK